MKLALLGRDGVINAIGDGGITHRTQWKAIDGSIEAIVKLNRAGFTVVVLTHQPGLSRGLFDLDELEAIHSQLMDAVEQAGGNIAGIFYCPHDFDERCHCRPPSTGLIDVVEMELDCDAQGCWYFCHNEAEIASAVAKQCLPICCTKTATEVLQYSHLLEAVDSLLAAHQ